MNIKDIVNSINGKDVNGQPNAAITLSTATVNIEDDKISNESVISACHPFINIESRGDYVQIDIIFKSYVDIEFKTLWAGLEKYGVDMSEKDDCGIDEPIAVLTLVPLKYNGKYYVAVTAPIFWTLQSEVPGAESNMIRMLFYEDNFTVYETDDINIEDLKSEVDREFDTTDYINSMIQTKEKEREDYVEEQNSKIESLRKRKY